MTELTTAPPIDDIDVTDTVILPSRKGAVAGLLKLTLLQLKNYIGLGATLDTDGTLAANSDLKVASQKAVRTYVANAVAGLLDLKGGQDCSANPNYPAASKGDYYFVTVAGKIGGAAGTVVTVGDVFFANADNAGGTQAAVGASWDILHTSSLVGALLAANNLSDVANAATAWANILQAALAADLNTGTDTTKAVTADALAGSNFGKAVITLLVSDPNGSALTVGDGKAYWRVPSALNGMNLVSVAAALTTVSSVGIPTVQIANVTDAVDMLSTKLTVDATETDSSTAAAAAVIDATKDDVATGDMLRIDVDVAGTGAKGLMVEMQFQLP
jgi:hypothetical protein